MCGYMREADFSLVPAIDKVQGRIAELPHATTYHPMRQKGRGQRIAEMVETADD